MCIFSPTEITPFLCVPRQQEAPLMQRSHDKSTNCRRGALTHLGKTPTHSPGRNEKQRPGGEARAGGGSALVPC